VTGEAQHAVVGLQGTAVADHDGQAGECVELIEVGGKGRVAEDQLSSVLDYQCVDPIVGGPRGPVASDVLGEHQASAGDGDHAAIPNGQVPVHRVSRCNIPTLNSVIGTDDAVPIGIVRR